MAEHPTTRCAVPFCERTSTEFPQDHEWLCADHWREVDPALKRLRSRLLRREWKRFHSSARYARLSRVILHRMKRQAFLRSVGLDG